MEIGGREGRERGWGRVDERKKKERKREVRKERKINTREKEGKKGK